MLHDGEEVDVRRRVMVVNYSWAFCECLYTYDESSPSFGRRLAVKDVV